MEESNYQSQYGSYEGLSKRNYQGCCSISEYNLERKLGEGTFGVVHMARHRKSGKLYALKRVLLHNENEGLPITALRELKILKTLRHKNVISIENIVVKEGDITQGKRSEIYMALPYMDHDLSGLLENPKVKFEPSHIKCYMMQILEGMRYLHLNKILHRDIKTSNLLVDNNGILKIADFGLARAITGPDAKYTNLVVTRWYRPPELLLGKRDYDSSIDMWGIGCVFGQLLKNKPLLPGSTDIEQIDLIFQLLGTPTEETMPGWTNLPGVEGVNVYKEYSRTLENKFFSFDKDTLELLDGLLKLDPAKRLSADAALDLPYFHRGILPVSPSRIPKYESSHEFNVLTQLKKERMDAMKRSPNDRNNRFSRPDRLEDSKRSNGWGHNNERRGRRAYENDRSRSYRPNNLSYNKEDRDDRYHPRDYRDRRRGYYDRDRGGGRNRNNRFRERERINDRSRER